MTAAMHATAESAPSTAEREAYDAGYAAKLAGWDREDWAPERANETGSVRSWLQGWDAAEQAIYHQVMQLKREANRG